MRAVAISIAVAAALLAACGSDAPESATDAAPREAQVAGISRSALDAARAELEKQVADGRIAGGAHMVVREGEVLHFHVAGVDDIEDQTPLEADAIMRIYSMTKPVVSVAAMMLWEQGKFALDDPISKYIPAFADARVLAGEGDSTEWVALERPITVRDALRHTTGYSYGRGSPSVVAYYEAEGVVYDAKHGMFPPQMTIADAAEALARIPLLHQPGATFTYGFSTDLLGRLVEIWSEMPLDEFLALAIFEPLEMIDTGFSVPEADADRFASCHNWEGDTRVIADKAESSSFLEGFEFLSGGGGLVSTMQDYANFCQMLVDGGEFNGRRLLEPATLERMFTDQLKGVAGDFRFGLGFAIGEVEMGTGDEMRKANSYHWGGYANTAFVVVPEERLFQVFMRQSIPSTHETAYRLFDIVYSGTH
jgi:CubicO group peptidase (beta-lactamase class C family)